MRRLRRRGNRDGAFQIRPGFHAWESGLIYLSYPGYRVMRRLARFWAIEENTAFSSLALSTS